MIKQQFTLYLSNRPGALASVAAMLAKDKINIEGMSVAESTDTALVQLVVDKPGKTKKGLEAAGIAFTTQKVALVSLPHEAGALSKFAKRLTKEKVNIDYLYVTALDEQGDCCMIVSARNLKKVEAAAKSL